MRRWSVFVLLLPVICCSLAGGQSPTTAKTRPTATPSLTPRPTPTTQRPGGWEQALQDIFAQATGNSAAEGNNSAAVLGDLLSQLPGVIQGLGGVDLSQGDAGSILARLFADPRAAGIPAWIESLTQGANGSAVQDAQALLQMLSNQSSAVQTQAVLGQLFSDVTKGLQSLDLNANSSLQDVLSAVMNDSGLMSSLSMDALQMLAALTGNTDVQGLLQQVFPMDPRSQCAADLQTWANALQGGNLATDMWAIQMLDAMGKLQAGLLTGQLLLVGDYAECRAVSFTNNSYTLEAHFCPMLFSAPAALASFFQDQSMAMHLCVPKSCNDHHLYGLLQPTLQALGSEHQGIKCVGPLDPEGDNRFIGVTTTLAVLAFLCAIGTAYGVVLDRQKAKQQQKQPMTIPVEMKAYTNHGYVAHGDAPLKAHTDVNGGGSNGNVPNTPNGNPVNGGLAIGDACNMPVNGGPSNEKTPYGGHVIGYVKHREGEGDLTEVSGGMAKPQFPGGPVVCVPETTATGSNPPSSGTSPPFAQEGALSKLLLSFSVLKNGVKVLSCERTQTDIGCLHGIRVLSITWVVLGHVFSMINISTGNSVVIYQSLQDWPFMAVLAGVLAVDTFFLLSGCLSAFLFLRTTKKSGLTISGLVLYYIHRVWRLTPLYAMVLAVYVGIFPYLKEGPYQHAIGMDSETSCRHYWHLNVLYVNNIVNIDHLCFGVSWYLSNDMQFSFLAPLVLVPWALKKGSLKRLHVLGFVLCAGMILTHCIATGVISYTSDLSMMGPNNADYMQKVYFPPWTRIGPYAVGLLLGYLLFVTPAKYSMDKLSVFLGWTVATAVGLTLVYVRYDNVGHMLTKGLQWDAAQNTAFESLDKVLWAMCVAWVIFACCKGYGGFVNTLLSWTAWMPLSRLTYGVYLVHCIVLFVLAGQFKKPLYLDNWSATTLFLATTVISFLLSFIFSMLVEAPTLGLEKVVLGKIFRSRK